MHPRSGYTNQKSVNNCPYLKIFERHFDAKPYNSVKFDTENWATKTNFCKGSSLIYNDLRKLLNSAGEGKVKEN